MISARPPSFFRPAHATCHRPTPPPPLLGRLLPSPAAGLPPHWALASGRPSPPPPSPLTAAWASPSFFFLGQPTAQPLALPLARTRTALASPPLPEMAPHSPPPLFTPHSPLRFPSPPNWTTRIDAATIGRSIPFPVRLPRSPLQPYKRARSSPLLTALIPIPHFPLSEPLVAPHRASPPPFALHHRRPRLIVESAAEALGEDPRSSSPFSPTRSELLGSAVPASRTSMSALPCPGHESTMDRPPLRGPQPVDSVHRFSFVKINQNPD
jgi:hypothetical protein